MIDNPLEAKADPTPLELLRDVVKELPGVDPETGHDPTEQGAHAALAALAEPEVAIAALAEQQILDRLASASPHLVTGAFAIVKDPDVTRDDGTKVTGAHIEGSDECPDCTRGTWSAGGVLVCATLPRLKGIAGIDKAKPGDMIACGRER